MTYPKTARLEHFWGGVAHRHRKAHHAHGLQVVRAVPDHHHRLERHPVIGGHLPHRAALAHPLEREAHKMRLRHGGGTRDRQGQARVCFLENLPEFEAAQHVLEPHHRPLKLVQVSARHLQTQRGGVLLGTGI